MPQRHRAPGGRPAALRLGPRASGIIRGEVDRALIEHHKPAAFLAGKAAGMERSERTVRQDFSNRDLLKLDAALFLVRRAFELRLIKYQAYFRLRAVIELCHPRPEYRTNAAGLVIPGSFFMAAHLEHEIIAAIENAVPGLRNDRRRAVTTSVQRVLDAAEERAHKARLPQAYIAHLRERMVPPNAAQRRARARAYSLAREQLGNEAVAIAIEDDVTLYYRSFLDD